MSDRARSSSADNSVFSPLHQPLFRALWIASLVSNIGSWMQEVGAGWLMTSLTTSPTLIGLLETAMTLPIFLLSLPAGALADILDKRRILVLTQAWMLLLAFVMGVVALSGGMTPMLLLALTFVMGVGAAMNGPAWQAILPEITTKDRLPSAVALGSVGFNVARAVGPALGGIIVAAIGSWAVFILNGISFLGVIVVLMNWRRQHRESVLPAERIIGAIRAGLRYARFSPALQNVLVRTAAFILFGSAMWATLPYIVRHEMGRTSVDYGLFIGMFGTGAVAGAAALTKLRKSLSVDSMVRFATLLFSGLLFTLAFAKISVAISCAMVIGGMAWMVLMSSLNLAAQMASPAWVRARAMAIYILVFFGGFAGGAALWGIITTRAGTTIALSLAATGGIIAMVTTFKYKLAVDSSIDLSPSMHWAEPVLAAEPHPDRGPVLITVEYRVTQEHMNDFSKAVHALSRIRRRDGAVQWGIYNDVSEPERYVETFVVESWIEHMRQHERITVADREIESHVHSFHVGPQPPSVSHFIYTTETSAQPVLQERDKEYK